MTKYKILAVISVEGETETGAVNEIQCMLDCWEDMRGENGKNISISIKTINNE